MTDLVPHIDRLWRAANYLSVGQIYLLDNPLLRRPLEASDIKPRLLGHWGTTPGLNFMYAHLQRAVVEHDLQIMFVAGPGHGGPAMLAQTWLEGRYSELYPSVSLDEQGMQALFRQFSFPRGVPSHVAPETPGSIHEGGELGYSLAHAVGAVLDNPDLVAAVAIGDGEAETAALSASWQSAAFLDPVTDGAVLPILHLNGYKIANPTVLARRSDDELTDYLTSQGWEPAFVHVDLADERPDARSSDQRDDHDAAHQHFSRAVDLCVERLAARRTAAASGSASSITRRIPMIVLRSPKGWTGPRHVDGEQIEGTWRAHQVPLASVRSDDDHRRQLESWMRSYRPDELFDDAGRPRDEVIGWLAKGDRRISAAAAANGGTVLRPLELPDHHHHARAVESPATTTSEPTQVLGSYLREVFALNEATRNFRLFGPDETESNRLGAVYESTDKAWQLERLDSDLHLDPQGRVMEVLSEHLCQGWLEGYLLSGRHGLFSCYEAFIHIVDSMFNQHAKWLKVHRKLPWRAPIASLNYLLTSHVWRQDHNGFSHQDPGFIDHVVSKGSDLVRVYLPPDTNSLLAVTSTCLQSRDLVNVIVSGKQPTLDVLGPHDADLHAARGVGIWPWASNDAGDPDVVLACAGDVPTLETLAAVSILRERLPNLRVRVVNVVDLMRLADEHAHPHGLSDAEFDSLFTTDRPIVFAFHGYPWLIHRLAYRRTNHPNLHVRGYKEEGSTTTPFDMVVRNDVDRFRLVMDVVDRVPHLRSRAAQLRQDMVDMRTWHVDYVTEHGEDLPGVRDWTRDAA